MRASPWICRHSETLYEAEVLQIAVKRAFQGQGSSAVTSRSCRTKRDFLRSARVQSIGPRPIQKCILKKLHGGKLLSRSIEDAVIVKRKPK